MFLVRERRTLTVTRRLRRKIATRWMADLTGATFVCPGEGEHQERPAVSLEIPPSASRRSEVARRYHGV
jgi:hypothetical protein